MISLGGVTLDKHMEWADEFGDWTRGVGVTDETIEGGVVTQRHQRPSNIGRPITLVATANHGWQTRTIVIALRALADVPNTDYTLTLHVGESEEVSYTVKFRHNEAGHCSFKPISTVENPGSDFNYIGTLKLIQVA